MGKDDEATVPIEELNQLQSDYDDLEKKFNDLTKEHGDLTTERDDLKKAKDDLEEKFKDIDPEVFKTMQDRLAEIDKKEKDELIKAILAAAKEGAWDQKDLEEMDLERLKLIVKALDSIEPKTRFKGIRPGAAAGGGKDGNLTVGNLYHTPFENPQAPPGGGS